MGEAVMLRSGGGGAPKQPTAWKFLQAISANGSFTMQKNTWYRIHVYGKSGDGGTTNVRTMGTTSPGYGAAGGGGSGGYACSILLEKQDKTVNCTVNTSITSFGSYLSATAGANGVSNTTNYNKNGTAGGSGGGASGGNQVNTNGFAGGNGGNGYNVGARGGNSGGYGGALDTGGSMKGGGGGGGARLPNSPYTGDMGTIGAGGRGSAYTLGYEKEDGESYQVITYYTVPTNGGSPPAWNSVSPPKVYGGGGGGGGQTYSDRGAVGGTGTPGLIIIEVAA